MMYPYMVLADDTEIVHSHVFEEDGVKKVLVHFERPTEDGFDSARCELPSYKWILRDGFNDEEIELFEKIAQYFIIIDEWKKFFVTDDISFYC